MAGIFVLAEHRRGELREISYEMLGKGKELAEKTDTQLAAVLLGYDVKGFAQELKNWAAKVLVIENKQLEHFNSQAYQKALSHLIGEQKPILTLIGHTSFGMDLAPSLATELGLPLVTDCIDLDFEDGKVVAIRQIYGGKVNTRVSLCESEGYLVTIRQGAFPIKRYEPQQGQSILVDLPLPEVRGKRFIGYVEAPIQEIDITKADFIVGVGRGIGEQKNIPLVEGLAEALRAVLACSRPIVDKKWLPKDRQVGTSGKTVKPKLYLAIGISGSFQHIAGMRASDTIIAINKDPKAPIFSLADYGIVADLFRIVPVLKRKIEERAK